MSSTQHNQPTNTYNPLPLTTSGEATMVIIIVLFLFFIITLILFIRAKHYPGIIGVSNARPHLVFATNQSSPLLHYPLDPSVLKSLPVAVFRSEDFKEQGGLECAVCLSEFSDGENARVLPKCKHGFHVECIDMWFASNSSCPLCRLPVAPPPTVNLLMDNIAVTNFDEASSSTNADSSSEKQAKGMLVIEIPECMSEGPSPLNSPLPVEMLGSFRKILSRGSNVLVGDCSSIRACDIEQGAAVQLAGEKS